MSIDFDDLDAIIDAVGTTKGIAMIGWNADMTEEQILRGLKKYGCSIDYE